MGRALRISWHRLLRRTLVRSEHNSAFIEAKIEAGQYTPRHCEERSNLLEKHIKIAENARQEIASEALQ